MSLATSVVPTPGRAPELRFRVDGSGSLPFAAVPTLRFALRVEADGGEPVRSVLLDAQIQIAARRRDYDPAAQERLLELFGAPERWASTLRTLPWLRTTLVVPPFTGSTVVELLVPCTYDLEVTASRYLAALTDGVVPLEFLFSGSVFFSSEAGKLQIARIAWDREIDYELPVAVWREMMDRHFRGTAWLRVDADRFGRLCAYKARHAFASWDAAIDSLLDGREGA
ncbi:MAG: hypothetical protein JOZ64_14905 [Solirubrobacterales bacterium]|nr:hypothetical protein [Solirubrobacterales bacterium]